MHADHAYPGEHLLSATSFSRMYQRIYLTVIGAVLVTVIITGGIISTIKSSAPSQAALRMFAELVADSITSAGDSDQQMRAIINGWEERSQARVALYGASGALVAGTTEIAAPSPAWTQSGQHGYVDGYAWRTPDGRWAIVQIRTQDQVIHWTIGFALAIVALLVGVAVFPVVRKITARLEALQTAVEALGDGNFKTRVDLGKGHDEVASLAQSFNRAAARIEALMSAQKTLLANSSHELRSPLARIQMAMGLIGTGQDAGAREEVNRSIRELDNLIGEILLASRFEAQNYKAVIDTQKIDLTALIVQEAARFQADVQGDHVHVAGDPTLLARLVRNLLENARRYGGKSGTEVFIELIQTGVVSPEVLIRVCDRGPGIPNSERERIFEPFYRIPGSSEREGGVGLGLALVRSIARQHGGTVNARPREGGGECFYVRLPVSAGTAMPSQVAT